MRVSVPPPAYVTMADDRAEPAPETPGMDWQTWVGTYGSRLYAYANGLDANAADDLVQHALLGTVKAVREGRLEPTDEAVLRYAYTAVRHAAFRHFSNRRRRGLLEGAWAAEQPWLGGSGADEDLCRRVEAAMAQLPPAYAEVLFLHLWGKQTFRAIAEMQGDSTASVASRYRYALSLIRQQLL